MLKRRHFLGLAALMPAGLPGRALAQYIGAGDPHASMTAQRAGSNVALPTDWSKVKTRTAPKAEILYKTPHGQPNGMALTNDPEQVWLTDQNINGWVTLIRIKDGSVVREFQADITGASGAVVDDEDNAMWISSTHNSLIVKVALADGKTIAKYDTPGSARKYVKLGDPPNRSSKLPLAYPGIGRRVGGLDDERLPGLARGQFPLQTQEWITGRTGAEGILLKGDNLYYSCTASRSIFCLNKKSWEIQSVWPTPGNRPHGMSWADAGKTSFWNTDANENASYRYDATTGQIVEKVQLQDDPFTVSHGTKIIGDYFYFCDDTGWMCRVRWT